MTTITEADVEQAALRLAPPASAGRIAHGPDIAPDTPNARSVTTTARWCWSVGSETPSPN